MNVLREQKNQAILVTGGAGFIGSKVIEKLIDNNYKVVSIDDYNDYYDQNLKYFRRDNLKEKYQINVLNCSINNKDQLKKLFQEHRFSAVINLAARAGVRRSLIEPELYYQTNVMGSLYILELMKEFGVSKYILASTSSLYAGGLAPFVEDRPVNEPISPYAASKKAAEVMAFTYHHLYKIDVSIVRYFTVYGPGSRPDMAQFRFLRWIDEGKPLQISGDGMQRRDFTYVDDIATGTILALKNVGYDIFNLGGGSPATMIELAEVTAKYLGKKLPDTKFSIFHPADMNYTEADNQKAKNILGWQPQFTLQSGIESSVSDYLDKRAFYQSISLNDL